MRIYKLWRDIITLYKIQVLLGFEIESHVLSNTNVGKDSLCEAGVEGGVRANSVEECIQDSGSVLLWNANASQRAQTTIIGIYSQNCNSI